MSDLRFDPATYDARRAEVAAMIDEADRQDDGPMGPDGLADALMEIAEGWAVALTPSQPEPGLRDDNRYVWLIERGQPEGLDHPEWWGVTDSRTGAYGWVDTVWPADQFATRAEAEAVIARFDLPNHPFPARPVEHGFIPSLAAPSQARAAGRGRAKRNDMEHIETDCDGECYGVGCEWCWDAWYDGD